MAEMTRSVKVPLATMVLGELWCFREMIDSNKQRGEQETAIKRKEDNPDLK